MANKVCVECSTENLEATHICTSCGMPLDPWESMKEVMEADTSSPP